MILNTKDAVKTFAALGSVQLGGNLSIAAGPIGRSAEASGTASHRGVSAVFSYSKTKGLFAGVSLEGSVLIERRDANAKFYRRECTAKHILNGSIPPPPGVEPLHRVLESRVFAGIGGGKGGDMYNDIPVYGDADADIWEGRDGEAFGEGVSRPKSNTSSKRGSSSKSRGYENDYDDDVDDMDDRFGSQDLNSKGPSVRPLKSQSTGFRSTYSDAPPSRPTSEKPRYGEGSSSSPRKDKEREAHSPPSYGDEVDDLDDDGFARPAASKPPRPPRNNGTQAVALFTFDADQAGDLGFKKGDVIRITQKSDSTDDWWTGEIGGRSGIFPVCLASKIRETRTNLLGELRAAKVMVMTKCTMSGYHGCFLPMSVKIQESSVSYIKTV